MFGRKASKKAESKGGVWNDENLLALFGMAKYEVVDTERSENGSLNLIRYKMDGDLFEAKMTFSGLSGADGRDYGIIRTMFSNDGTADLLLVNGYNAQTYRTYAVWRDDGVLITTEFDFIGEERSEDVLAYAMIKHRRGVKTFNILRNHYVSHGNIDNVTLSPNIFD